MAHLLLFKDGGGQNDAFTSLLDSGAQEQRAQVLFNCAGLMSSSDAISLLLQPCTNNFNTSWSRRVILT
jgi:hypothetical protein